MNFIAYIAIRMKKKYYIPPEHKCIRCHRDLRDSAPLDKICICSREHPETHSKSGYGIWITERQYSGFRKDFTHLIDF